MNLTTVPQIELIRQLHVHLVPVTTHAEAKRVSVEVGNQWGKSSVRCAVLPKGVACAKGPSRPPTFDANAGAYAVVPVQRDTLSIEGGISRLKFNRLCDFPIHPLEIKRCRPVSCRFKR